MVDVDDGELGEDTGMVTPDASELLKYVGAGDNDAALAETCMETSRALIAAFIGTKEVPASAVALATLQVAAELFQRRQAPNGILQFATPNGDSGIRVARDPMLSAYAILRPFIGLGIG